MPKMIVRSPFQKLKLADEFWFEPAALLHLFLSESLSPATTPLFGQIHEWALFHLQPTEASHYLCPDVRRESIPCTRRIDQVAPFVVSEDKRIEGRSADGVTADDKLLPL